MSLWQPLRNLWKKPGNKRTTPQADRRRTARPQIEGLEDRLLLDFEAVGNTTGFPWRAVVHLESRFPGESTDRYHWTCSGAMIDSFHVLTAAHCIYDQDKGGWATSVRATPGQNGTSKPFGVAYKTRLRTYTGFTRYGDWEYDIALVTLDRPIGQRTGSFGYETRVASAVNSAGYPAANGGRDGTRMYRTYGTVRGSTDTYLYASRSSSGLYFEGGQSGSPIWRYDGTNNYIEAVLHGHTASDYVGARINSGRFTDLQNWMNDDRGGGGCQPGIRCIGGGTGGTPSDRPDLTDADQWFGTSSAGFSASTVRLGDSFRVNAGVYNLGLGGAGNFVVSFYALTQSNINSTRYLIGQATVSSLGSFSQFPVAWEGSLPAMPAGQYYLGWVIDSGNSQTEYDESNNTGVLTQTRFTVAPDPGLVPSITFANYDNGVWAYNTSTNNWRHITGAQATVMDEGSDGVLYASFSSGTYRYDYWSASWSQLTGAQANELSAASDNTLFSSYDNGTWEYDWAGWHHLTGAVASQLAAVSDNRVYASFSNGTWEYDWAGWRHLTAAVANQMDAASDGTLIASYHGLGTYQYRSDGSTLLTGAVAQDIAVVSGSLFYATYSSGVWRYNNGWIHMTNLVASQIAADSSSFVGSFGGVGTIEYTYGWRTITGAVATLVA